MTYDTTRYAGPRQKKRSRTLAVATLAAVLWLQACVPVRWDGSGKTPSQSSKQSTTASGAKSKRGNPPFYEVYGVRYHVLDSSAGHRETGVASWYGKKFHGRQTSSGEIYDMYKMTAAHKTLPLPTQVRVTHLGNGKSIVVLVNDRGPFVDNRIIDLSYAAALELDMIGTGTALVEIEAVSGPGMPRIAASSAAAAALLTDLDPAPEPVPSDSAAAPQQKSMLDARLYLQVGAFGDPINARQLQQQLQTKGLSNVVIRYDLDTSPTIYRVRLGPIADVAEYDALVELMTAMQIPETHLTTETGEKRLLDLATTTPAGITGTSLATGVLSDG